MKLNVVSARSACIGGGGGGGKSTIVCGYVLLLVKEVSAVTFANSWQFRDSISHMADSSVLRQFKVGNSNLQSQKVGNSKSTIQKN